MRIEYIFVAISLIQQWEISDMVIYIFRSRFKLDYFSITELNKNVRQTINDINNSPEKGSMCKTIS